MWLLVKELAWISIWRISILCWKLSREHFTASGKFVRFHLRVNTEHIQNKCITCTIGVQPSERKSELAVRPEKWRAPGGRRAKREIISVDRCFRMSSHRFVLFVEARVSDCAQSQICVCVRAVSCTIFAISNSFECEQTNKNIYSGTLVCLSHCILTYGLRIKEWQRMNETNMVWDIAKDN